MYKIVSLRPVESVVFVFPNHSLSGVYQRHRPAISKDQRFLRFFARLHESTICIPRLLLTRKRRKNTLQAGPGEKLYRGTLSLDRRFILEHHSAFVADTSTTIIGMRYTSLLALSASAVHAIYSRDAIMQVTVPSNDSSDLLPASSSPRFLLNGTEFPDLPVISLAPLGPYAAIPRSQFVGVHVERQLINVNVDNSNSVQDNQIAYISCDPQAYSGYLNASDALSNILNSGSSTVMVILYSEYSNHCNVSNLNISPEIAGILTTTNPMAATTLANLDLSANSKGSATILPDLNSYTNSSGNGNFGDNGNLLGPSPTTAVAMIILYSITGIITALFIIIIVTGALRAHRHPERYGPRTVAGRTRQSRAKGIARAMLETLPIVKFGDHEDLPAKPADGSRVVNGTQDVEMATNDTHGRKRR